MKILIVDDERSEEFALSIAVTRSREFSNSNFKNAKIKIVRTFSEAEKIFKNDEKFDVLLLDHDLASKDVYDDGSKLMKILEERFYVEDFKKFDLIVPISSNPIGVKRIRVIAEKIT